MNSFGVPAHPVRPWNNQLACGPKMLNDIRPAGIDLGSARRVSGAGNVRLSVRTTTPAVFGCLRALAPQGSPRKDNTNLKGKKSHD